MFQFLRSHLAIVVCIEGLLKLCDKWACIDRCCACFEFRLALIGKKLLSDVDVTFEHVHGLDTAVVNTFEAGPVPRPAHLHERVVLFTYPSFASAAVLRPYLHVIPTAILVVFREVGCTTLVQLAHAEHIAKVRTRPFGI
ncbi:hypothetical protein APZ15_10365 [Burkholderia cepacia ATCC 25416]|nr:hypothetical protein APZ15_10365 [Burkholderia cepacia ATCC 25416]